MGKSLCDMREGEQTQHYESLQTSKELGSWKTSTNLE